jgi:predicted ArsR family transcriptional regulator
MSEDAARRGRREQVLETLRTTDSPLEILDIAQRMHVHPNTVRFHLASLVQAGRVEKVAGEHARRGRPPTAYRPVVRMDPDGPRAYRALAGVLADDVAARSQPSGRAVEIGRRWGRRLAEEEAGPRSRSARGSRERMRKMLDKLGFAPDADDDSQRIALRSCPFLELAETSTQVVCPIHLGLMQGALETWRAPITVERLEAFSEPDLCLVHLGPAAATVGGTS